MGIENGFRMSSGNEGQMALISARGGEFGLLFLQCYGIMYALEKYIIDLLQI